MPEHEPVVPGTPTNATVGGVAHHESLSRYIFRKSDFDKKKDCVFGTAFLPDAGETSVFRINGLTTEEVWDIGVNHVEAERKKAGSPHSLKARADFAASLAVAAELSIEPEVSMHPLHANLKGWSTTESLQELTALKIADKAKLHTR